ncbi:hypothetical protein [Streptomyces goshikiensis]|uniref:hypothetical protein n=1 Tax=Streptomyces goshikiensis TaxID=1942 RepID=UPI00369E855C
MAIIAFFAFSSGQGRSDHIGHLAASVILVALCGLAAHLVLAPARHVRHRQQAVWDLYCALSRRLNTLAELPDGQESDTEHLRHWRRDWRSLAADSDPTATPSTPRWKTTVSIPAATATLRTPPTPPCPAPGTPSPSPSAPWTTSGP